MLMLPSKLFKVDIFLLKIKFMSFTSGNISFSTVEEEKINTTSNSRLSSKLNIFQT